MSKKVKKIEKELKKTQEVLGILIAWLTRELGEQQAKDLLNKLNNT